MDPAAVVLLSIGLLVLLVLLGTPIGLGLAFTSIIGLWGLSGRFATAISILGTTAFSAVCDYQFSVIPLFILMGVIANLGGFSRELYDVALLLVGKLRGGLAIATVVANAVFAAITGVSVASAAVFSKISLPQMIRLGYDRKFALGTVAGSSVLGMLIPPSILLIVYGLLSEQAVGRLFVAGIIPGIILAAIYSIGIIVMCTLRPSLTGGNRYQETITTTMREKLGLVSKCWGIIILIVVVLGGIYGGIFTPTEAGAAGAAVALLLTIVKRKASVSGFRQVLLETGFTTTSILFLLIAAQMYSRMLGVSGVLTTFSQLTLSLNVSPIVIVLIFVAIFIALGTILDSTSILLLTMPVMVPVIRTLGFDLIWFGIVSIVAIEMGLLTPPFGMCVYAMKGALGDAATIEEIFRGSMPFLVMMVIALAIFVAFPPLSTWLQSTM